MDYVYNEDLWFLHDARKYYIVITTNIGWKKDGSNIMGAGLAKQAASKYPFLPEKYGMICKDRKQDTPVIVFHDIKLVMLPTKALNAGQPWLSWKNNSSIELIERGLLQIKDILKDDKIKKLGMSCPGAANGNIPIKRSLNLVKRILGGHHKVIMCDLGLR